MVLIYSSYNAVHSGVFTNCFLNIQLRGLVVKAFAYEAWWTGFDSQLGHTKDFKNGICCFACFNAQHLRVAQRIKKQSVDHTSVKEKLIQSWRYKTLSSYKAP